MSLRRVLALIWKELLVVFLDSRSRIAILLPPVIQLLVFAYAATLDVKNVELGVVNRDNGERGFELVQRFRGSPVFTNLTYLPSVDAIGPYIDNQKGMMVLSIDETFSRNLDAGKNAEVQLIFDGRRSNSAQILSGYSSQIIQEYAPNLKQNTRLIQRNWFNPNILYIWYNIPCLVVTLSMLACLVVTTQSIAREKEMGTWDQLLVSPLKPLEILIGKIVPGILVGMVEGCFMGVMGVYMMGVPFTGSIPLFFLSLFVFVSAISGVGLFISSLSSTQQQAMLGSFTFMLPSVLLSGFATPIENMPTWLQPVTYCIPMRYMLVITKGIFLKNLSSLVVLSNLWQMGVIGACTLVGSGLFFRKKIG